MSGRSGKALEQEKENDHDGQHGQQ